MSQATTIALTGRENGTVLHAWLESVANAWNTNNLGPNAPSYAQPGTTWIDTSGNSPILKIYDNNNTWVELGNPYVKIDTSIQWKDVQGKPTPADIGLQAFYNPPTMSAAQRQQVLNALGILVIFTQQDKTKLSNLANIKTIGDNLSLSGAGVLSATATATATAQPDLVWPGISSQPLNWPSL